MPSPLGGSLDSGHGGHRRSGPRRARRRWPSPTRSRPATLAMAIVVLMATFADDDGHHSGCLDGHHQARSATASEARGTRPTRPLYIRVEHARAALPVAPALEVDAAGKRSPPVRAASVTLRRSAALRS